jgi:hypothetical protein
MFSPNIHKQTIIEISQEDRSPSLPNRFSLTSSPLDYHNDHIYLGLFHLFRVKKELTF